MKVGTTLSFTLLASLLLALLALPLVTILFKQLAFDFQGFLSTVRDGATLRAVGLSCFAASISVLIALVLGTPLAYLLARKEFRGKKIIEGFVNLPAAVPHVVAGIALLTVFGRGGWIGRSISPILTVENSMLGIVIAMLFVSTPFLVNSAVDGFKSVDPRLERVARSLGATEWAVFRRISFPLAFPHIFSGAVMSWARAISEFAAVVMLVGFFPMIAPGMIWYKFYTAGLQASMGVATLLLIISLSVFVLLKYTGVRMFAEH